MKPLYAFFGHHKCGSTWVNDILRDVSSVLGLKRVVYHDASQFGGDLPRSIEADGIDFLCLSNAFAAAIKPLSGYRGFHVVRDPRDIVVSAYFSHRYSHEMPGLGAGAGWLTPEYRQALQAADEEVGLMMVLERRARHFTAMREWDYAQPHILEVRFEDITVDPGSGFRRVFSHLGLIEGAPQSRNRPLSDAELDEILDRHSFIRKTRGRRPGDEDPKAHYRKGTPGDWKNHFTPDHIRYFKAHYNELLLKLGYEQSPDW